MAFSDINISQAKTAINNIKNEFMQFFIEPSDPSLTDLKLDIVGTETLSMENDITDNYVETNIAYQDQIAKKPIIYTVRGEVGEVAWYKKNEENSIIGALPSKLTPVVEMLPMFSKSAKSFQDKAMKIIGVADSLDNYVSRFLKMGENVSTSSKQQRAYIYLRMLRELRLPINIKSAWHNLSGYIVQSVELSQSGTQDKTSVSVTFKEFRETDVSRVVKFDAKQFQNRLEYQKQEEEKAGYAGEYKKGFEQGAAARGKFTIKGLLGI